MGQAHSHLCCQPVLECVVELRTQHVRHAEINKFHVKGGTVLANILLIMGALLAAYGLSIMLVWSGTIFFLVWLALAMIATGIGIMMRRGLWQHLPSLLRKALGAATIIGLLVVISLSSYVMHKSRTSTPNKAPDNLEWIIVLGAQVRGDGSPSTVLRYRLDSAIAYLDTHPNCQAIVSGGQGLNEPTSEAECMANYLLSHGIAQERIVQEAKSRNTVENILFSAQVLKEHGANPHHVPIGIVTNDFHTFRATAIAHKQGLKAAVGISAYSLPWYLPNNLLRECLGIVKDTIAGNM
ncbi:hypothetical protein HMPREF9069_01028 [Atopobium sp. oral taxon 810 str. F0209]|nr:hypothetical protein HMPREF9069_01028 [Atopobium sp. oral taxon 810 str. F0209]